MGNVDYESPSGMNMPSVGVPPPQPFLKSLKYSMKETFFPDDPLRRFKNKSTSKRLVLGLQYFLPIFEWAPQYTVQFLKSDLIAGITIASLAIPQGISYAKLANLPPILGLYSSFIPPLIYAMMGSSRDLAVGTVAVGSLLMGSMLSSDVNPNHNPNLFLHLAFTATFFAGLFQASLGLFRLGFIVDFLSHATIVGFMGGAATVVCLQQLKSILGLDHFTHETYIVSVMRSVFTQTHQWRRESAVLGVCFIFFLLLTRFFEGIAVGRSFAMFKNYHIDGNKEMIDSYWNHEHSWFFHLMLPHYRAIFAISGELQCWMQDCSIKHSIIVSAMLGLIDYEAAIHLWKIDKFDFVVALSLLRILLFITRPRTFVLGNIPNSVIYRNVEQYPNANHVPGILILEINAPIYFANASYLRERITRWIDEEEDRIKVTCETILQYVIMVMTAVGNIDTSGISMLEEVKKIADRRGLQLVLVNPGSEVMKKLNKSKFQVDIGQKWIYLTVAEVLKHATSCCIHANRIKAKMNQRVGTMSESYFTACFEGLGKITITICV
ncbi:hypothetical protein TanjilG_24586 [Lupinus angustifolius]|uniref:STAS domain-containing protein n=1 Tax=Lupinus angustifolius TaxID=3871 RepID=A0A4P1RKK6_LUPAN|nr:hypothetical protein TanjilG_24586 [Lupinus angustifolius]